MDKKELILKAKEAKSVEELLALARENNIELTEEQAKECYDRLNSIGELSDDELEKVAGGFDYFRTPDGTPMMQTWDGKWIPDTRTYHGPCDA